MNPLLNPQKVEHSMLWISHIVHIDFEYRRFPRIQLSLLVYSTFPSKFYIHSQLFYNTLSLPWWVVT
jgi:hypothetical protein